MRRCSPSGADRRKVGQGEREALRVKILLFGGTFDPPHLGHLALLRNAVEALDPDLALVMPAGIPHAVFAPEAFKMLLTVVFPTQTH